MQLQIISKNLFVILQCLKRLFESLIEAVMAFSDSWQCGMKKIGPNIVFNGKTFDGI